jgi:hypothetical protein
MHFSRTGLLLLSLAVGGCDYFNQDFIQDNVKVDVTGTLEVTGDRPDAFDLQLFSQADNGSAFDISGCVEQSEENPCLGTVDVDALETAVGIEAVVDGDSFTFPSVPIDLFYLLVATGADDAVACSTDVVGFDEETKLITANSTIRISADSLTGVQVPRAVELNCSVLLTEPTLPDEKEQAPAEEGTTDPETGDIPASEDPTASWTAFSITDKDGNEYANASADNVDADLACGDAFPPVLEVHGTAANASAAEAFLRIQFGSDEEATFRTIPVPIIDGQISQAVSLTGGFAVVQLDFNDALDGDGESYVVRFCDRADPPAQELLTILSWDIDDTDADTHIYSQETEVAYYSKSQSWGDLDIDDVDGFGPETFTSKPDQAGQSYEVRVHYYSDHGNGDANATMRVVYFDASTDTVCDITATHPLASGEWWTVGQFGPGLECPSGS